MWSQSRAGLTINFSILINPCFNELVQNGLCLWIIYTFFCTTLKGMLGKKDGDGCDWFPWFHLFYLAFRSALGIYCIHELLLSRQPLIPIDVIKEAWEHQPSINVSLIPPLFKREWFSQIISLICPATNLLAPDSVMSISWRVIEIHLLLLSM